MEIKMVKKYLTAFLASCMFGTQAATYYVSPLGKDSDPGTTPGKPLKTLRQALRKTAAGDTVLLKGGIYREQIEQEWPQRSTTPITIKAMPDETPVITFGWRIRGWKKGADRLFYAPCAYAVRDLWQRNTLDRYFKVDSLKLAAKKPGAFYQRPGDGMLFVNPLAGGWHDDPEKAGFTVVPYSDGSGPASFNTKKKLSFRTGMSLVGQELHVSGLHFAFHPQCGFSMRGRKVDKFYASGSIRNCSVVGTTCGLKLNWVLDGIVIENCRIIRNSGGGIVIGSYVKNFKVRNNFLLDNGNCQPFYDNYTATDGSVYNMSRYGSFEGENVDFTGNTILSLDKSRQGGVMRCKGGIAKHTNVLNNVVGGGGVTFYAVPGSTATIDNNTVFPGKFYFTTSNTGKKYRPDLKDNIYGGADWEKKAGFINPEKYDFRLLPSSPYKGIGAFPGPAPVYFASPKDAGDGRAPKAPAGADKLSSFLKSGDTVYFLPGNYSGRYSFRNLKEITLSDRSCGKAVWKNASFTFDGCENVKIDGMDFKNCRFEFINTSVSFTEVLAENTTFKAEKGKSVFANSRLFKFKVQSSGRTVFRENLLDNCSVKAADAVSEHNGFADASQLKKWPFKETFPSFVAGVRLNGKIVFPAKNLVEGTAGTWIGGRAVKDVKGLLKVKNVAVAPLECGTRALVSWTTPEDYVRAEITVRQNNRQISTVRVPFGKYLSCDNAVCLKGLKPGIPVEAELRLYRHNETTPWKKMLKFTPVKSAVKNTPKVLEAGDGKTFKTVAAAVQAARPGDTVLIAPGTYDETFTVLQDGITVKAARPGTVKLSAAFMFDFVIRAEDVKNLAIENLDFTGLRYSSAVYGVTFKRVKGLRMKNCRFLAPGSRRMGNNHFFGRYLKDVEISNCVFDRGFQGVWIQESTGYVKLDHNTFWGCGVNAVHLTGGPGAELSITNNLFADVVSNHSSPAVSVGSPKSKVVCDWNLYWHTKIAPRQKIFGMGGVLGIHAVSQVLQKDAMVTIEETRQRYKLEKNGLFVDPEFRDIAKGDFSLRPGSPARKRGSDGRDIGADLTVFAAE